MAVAVKTPQGTPSAGSQVTPAIVSLVGVLFLLACLAIVFKLIPDLWWTAWDGLGWARLPSSAVRCCSLSCWVWHCVVHAGHKLLGPNRTWCAGWRRLGFLGLVLVFLLARWASLWLEHWAYSAQRFRPRRA